MSDRGYAPAVRVGDHAWVSGAVALDGAGQLVGGADTYEQSRAAFSGVTEALRGVALTTLDIVQVRIYLTPEANWGSVARAFKEAFSHVQPAATMVRVHSLALPGLQVEVEATAVDRARNDSLLPDVEGAT